MSAQLGRRVLLPLMLLLPLLPLLLGCPGSDSFETQQLADDPKFTKMIGRRYESLEPLYVVDFDDGSAAPGTLYTKKLFWNDSDEVSPEAVGTTIGDHQILAHIKEGTVFEIVDAVLDKNPVAGDRVDYFLRPEGELSANWPRIGSTMLLGRTSTENGKSIEVPDLDPAVFRRLDGS